MAGNLGRGKQYVKQAWGRYLALRGQLATAEAGAPDWAAIHGESRSLEANLQSAAADLEVNLDEPETKPEG